jgi:hypothetical protein
MLRLAPMTALARCVCEIEGMAEGQLRAVSASFFLAQLSDGRDP